MAAFFTLQSAAQSAENLAGKVLRIPVTNAELSQGSRWRELRTLMDKAVEAGAERLIFDINVSDSPGMTTLPMAEEVARLKVRTTAYVNPAAVGGGALLALACDEIWMAPGSRIGAVPPLVAPDKDQATTVQETLLADALARLKGGVRSLAKLKGHRTDVAEAFVDRSLGLQVGGRILAGKGELLLLDGDDAATIMDGKPLLAHGLAASLAEAVKLPSGSPEIVTLTAALFREAPPEKPAEKQEKKHVPGPVAAGAVNYAGKVVVIAVGEKDLMARARFEFMSRTLERASNDGAEAVIFDLDTPGGLAWDTTNLMMKDLQKLKSRSFAFVNPRAMSAGAMIAVATDVIYMAPRGAAGAATPVLGSGMEIGAAERAKINSAVMGMARTVAKEKGHDARVIEAMIDADRELVVNGEVLSAKGELLTLDAHQATMIVDGRPLFAKAIVNSIDDIKKAEGLKGETVIAVPTFFEHIAIWVTQYAAILILIGIAGGYLEMQTPGFGLFGIVSIVAFGLFFFGHYVAGSLVGHETSVVAALFVIGAILLAVEFLVFPGTFVFGIAGFLCVMVALVYTMSAWETLPPITAPDEAEAPAKFDFATYAIGLRNFVLGLVGAIVIIALLARFLPESRLFSRLVLAASAGGDMESTPAITAVHEVQVGDRGTAISALRPYGTVQFGNLRLEAVIESGYLQAGTEVRVREVRDTRIIVEPVA
jgi:membrane-bound serine protease (ClpP class)